MKRLILISICCLFASCNYAYAQDVCPAGKVCIDQSTANKCSAVADEVIALRKTVEAFKAERAASDSAISTRDTEITKLRERVSLDDQLAVFQDKYRTLRDRLDALKDDLIKNLEKKIANNKSFLQKLLIKLQVAYYILAGVAIVAK